MNAARNPLSSVSQSSCCLLDQALTVNDLSERLSISQYNASKHLRILREAGLVECTKMANRRKYAIPSRYREQSSEAPVLDLKYMVLRFEEKPPISADAIGNLKPE